LRSLQKVGRTLTEKVKVMALLRPKRHTDKTGDISEAAIITRLLQSGYIVLTPYGKNHRYDLLIEDADGQFWRIQCKTGWLEEEQTVIKFATASSYNHTAKQKGWRHYRGQIDFFAVYVEQLEKVYFVPVDTVGTVEATLRLAPTKNKQEKHVRWALDYEL
jgi:PD-(D/E)XK endonuclease